MPNPVAASGRVTLDAQFATDPGDDAPGADDRRADRARDLAHLRADERDRDAAADGQADAAGSTPCDGRFVPKQPGVPSPEPGMTFRSKAHTVAPALKSGAHDGCGQHGRQVTLGQSHERMLGAPPRPWDCPTG
jgi:hypothetical protein